MKITNAKLRNLLVDNELISAKDFKKVEVEAKKSKKDIANILFDTSLISEDNLGKLIAGEYGYNFISLKKVELAAEAIKIIPEAVARKQQALAFNISKDKIKVAMADPDNIEFIRFLEKKTGKKVEPYYATEGDILNAMSVYQKDVAGAFDEIIKKAQKTDLSDDRRDQTIVDLVDSLIINAYQNGVSDIHIEPKEKGVLMRFRIDGILHDMINLPKEFQEPMVARLKILAKLRTDEHRAAQDGKIRFATDNIQLDIRISVIPILFGEKIVMRLLAEKGRRFTLSEIGLVDKDLERVQLAIKRPHGMILVTGPTGSGKTTTLYAMLKILNQREVNITTIEDPIEYAVEGINQIQANTKTGLTFAKGLRSVVRQDPDIIMIGEIRDEETASIAVNSALTGHLVLSTLHTNDAATTLPRLLDMGVEPFLVASTVNIAIAQRLVRRICMNCIMSTPVNAGQIKLIQDNPYIKNILKKYKRGKLEKLVVYKGKGCSLCNDSGYKGRIGIYEVLELKENIRKLIINRASSEEIKRVAVFENDMITLVDNGIKKALDGQTTIEEVLRVAVD